MYHAFVSFASSYKAEILNGIITCLRSDECVPVYFTELFPTSGCWTKQGRLNVLLKRPVFIHLHRLIAFGSQYRIRSATVFDVL
ncbi:hypothetical protein MRX96_050703 [Rhipicephalus microplus]